MSPQVTEWDWSGPRRGIDRAVLLAHGAGSDMNAPALVEVARELARAGVPSLRFNFPYRSAGRRAPDRAPVLDAATRQAAAELARRSGLPPERLVLGGRSMGGRYCSLAVGDPSDPLPALGLVLLGYPLHPAGRPERIRSSHFRHLDLPVLFVSGDRDSLADWKLLRQHVRKIKGPVTVHKIRTGDHAFKPLRSSGQTIDSVLGSVAVMVADWVTTL